MKWVSVDDKLPEHWQWVLVWWPQKGGDQSVSVGWRTPGFDAKGPKEIWDLPDAPVSYRTYQKQITHWMPVPKAPGEMK